MKIICTEVRFKLGEDKLSARERIWIFGTYTCDLSSRIANFPGGWTQTMGEKMKKLMFIFLLDRRTCLSLLPL